MDFELKSLDLAAAAGFPCDALAVLVPDSFKAGKDPVSTLVDQARKAGDFESKAGKLLAVYKAPGVAARRLILVAAGDGSPRQMRLALAAAAVALKGPNIQRAGLALPADAPADAARMALQAVADATYVYTTTKPKADARKLGKLTLLSPAAADLQAAFAHGKAAVAGIELAKEWGNRPGNHATPSKLAEAAKALARQSRISCEVLGPREVAKLGMGSFMAVAQGSDEPLRFVVLHYAGAAKSAAPVVLVGKGITFDTGGISIKPAPEMDEMKFDMCGAASVLGVFRALGELKPAINVVGLIPTCENMPDGKAVKPGDVVTSMSGQTIEILNTDAEGRLILCDALTFAERFKPCAVVDIATLTGACVIALGGVRSGLFASDDALAQSLQAAGERTQDLCWRMPLDDDYAEGLNSHFADVANVAGRAGGSITAAKFLQKFAAKYPWAHLDIAGTAWKSGAAKGATGRPVGLLLEYLVHEAGRNAAATKPAVVRKGKAKV